MRFALPGYMLSCFTNWWKGRTVAIIIPVTSVHPPLPPSCYAFNSPTGNFMTQNIGNIVSTIGICLMTFASWQYTLQEPGCCYDSTVNVIGEFDNGSYWSPNCSELHKVILWKDANLHISPTVNMVLAIIGLTVSITIATRCSWAELFCRKGFPFLCVHDNLAS